MLIPQIFNIHYHQTRQKALSLPFANVFKPLGNTQYNPEREGRPDDGKNS